MTLHIAVDGVNAEEITIGLYDYYQSKNYKTGLCKKDGDWILNYIKKGYTLTNYQTALINAINETITSTKPYLSDYDIIFWENSIITDYLTLTDDNVTPYWLKQINKFTVKKDLYCYIKPTKKDIQQTNLHNIKNIIIIGDNGDIESNLNELIIKINKYFPHCQWCNNIYKKIDNHKYCSKTCKELAYQKKTMDRVNKFRRMNRNSNLSDYKSNLGSEAVLKQHRNNDFEKEHKSIINEKKRLRV